VVEKPRCAGLLNHKNHQLIFDRPLACGELFPEIRTECSAWGITCTELS
jgi:hypothetical protein